MTDAAILPKRKGKFCPMCGKKENLKYLPFCSKHCAELDLGKWLTGNYRIPVDEEEALDG